MAFGPPKFGRLEIPLAGKGREGLERAAEELRQLANDLNRVRLKYPDDASAEFMAWSVIRQASEKLRKE